MNNETKGILPKIKSILDRIKGICYRLTEMCRDHIGDKCGECQEYARDKYKKCWGYARDKYEDIRHVFQGLTLAIFILIAAFPGPAHVGVRQILIRLARWYEWVFATVLMTAIGVILTLRYLEGSVRVLLLFLLFVFLVATVLSQFHQAGWFGRGGRE